MEDQTFSGYGGKRPLEYIPYERLFLDPMNPRLPSNAQGKSEEVLSATIKKGFFIDEIAQSMYKNGYFDEEPLVGIPQNLPAEFEAMSYDELKASEGYLDFIRNDTTTFTIVEGNRRLCTIKLLLRSELPGLQDISEEIREDLSKLPVIIYPRRKDVIAYLGVRHIIGVKKWDAYAKARYIAAMKEDFGLTLREIKESVGDTTGSIGKTYACYRMIEQIQESFEDYDISKAKENFSYLMLAVGQGSIKDYIGLPKKWSEVNHEEPVAGENIPKLQELFSWIFGDGGKQKVIHESRDITGKLSPVLRSVDATQTLRESRDLNDAYERSEGEAQLALKLIKRANRDLGKVMPLVEKYYNTELQSLLDDTERLLESINRIKDGRHD